MYTGRAETISFPRESEGKSMSDIKDEAKIKKLVAKRKSDAIIKMMNKSNPEVTAVCLAALAEINDEAACNAISHCLDDADNSIRIAACKAALVINTDYMKTHIRYLLSKEKDEAFKAQVQELVNASNR